MVKMKKFFALLGIVSVILLLSITSFVRGYMSDAYYEQAKAAAVSLEEHVDSMLYNLDVFFESKDMREPKSALYYVYLHSVLCEEDFVLLQRYCDSYYSVSIESLLFDGQKRPATQNITVSALGEQTSVFQGLLQNIFCGNGLQGSEESQLYEELLAARNKLEITRDCLSKSGLSTANSTSETVKSFWAFLDDMDQILTNAP